MFGVKNTANSPPSLAASHQDKPVVSQNFPLLIQTKLTIGASDDGHEKEADAVAERVMRMPERDTPAPFNSGVGGIQRKCAHCQDEEKQRIQTKPLATQITPFIQRKGDGGSTVSEALSNQINATRGSGSPLPDHTRSFMEGRIGADFSGVRVHTGGEAVQMNRELNAEAFTVGRDVYFGAEKYSPDSSAGKSLLAHELTHVVQQTGKIQRQASPTAAPMTRAQFDQTMQNTYGVSTIRTGTMADQIRAMRLPATVTALPNWQSWDPGPQSPVYQYIVDAFAEFSRAFSGFPRVFEITFYNVYYDHQPSGTFVPQRSIGAEFGLDDLTVYKTISTGRIGLPFARSIPSGQYTGVSGLGMSYSGDANAAPVIAGSQRESAMRMIFHELGHGLQIAAMQPVLGTSTTPPDPSMMRDYEREVGWTTGAGQALYDIGASQVQAAFQPGATTGPPSQFIITAGNWNDPNWVEQPISAYMVSQPTEDFAEAVMAFVANPTLLQSRSPHRFNFINTRRALWQPRLVQPTAGASAPPGPASPVVPRLAPSGSGGSLLSRPNPDPLGLRLPSYGPNTRLIDWLAVRQEFTGRGAPFDDQMASSVTEMWLNSHRFFHGVMGFNDETSSSLANRALPRLVGSGLTRDYPSAGESIDRSMGTSSTIIPVSDIARFLINEIAH